MTSSSTPPPECSTLLNPSYVNLSFSLFILAGILVSYLPQHHRIISRGTSEGISPVFLFLGVTSGTCAFANILILSRGVLGCCGKGIGGFNCFAASLGVAQVGTQWFCFAVILLLFLIYFSRDTLTAPSTARWKFLEKQSGVAVAILCAVHFVVVAALTFYFSLLSPPLGSSHSPPATTVSPQLMWWANFLGIQSTVLASLQYLPQLYTTWTLKHVGSLSIPMMCIQTPGSFVWAVSLANREGTKWSSWITYVVTGALQGCLLVMCIIWEVKDRSERKERSEISNGVVEPERRPLLGNETS